MALGELFVKAKKTLDANIINYKSASYITAGGNQFKTLWVRDFCYSVPGLLELNYTELVKSQLQLILLHRHENGFLPRGLDVLAPQLRVVLNILGPKLSMFDYPDSLEQFKTKIKPEYFGEHNTVAFDSNILFIWAYLKYVEKTSDKFINDDYIKSLIATYEKFKLNGLFVQPAFSDWQDSVKRDFANLLFQVQYLSVLKLIVKLDLCVDNFLSIAEYQKLLLSTFFSKEKYLFFQDSEHKRLSLEIYGFIFSDNLFESINCSRLYQALKASSLWQSGIIPGVPVYPSYSGSDISWTTKAVGLAGYHDKFHWGWLVAESVKIATLANDYEESNRIENIFSEITQNDEFLSEIYLQKNNRLKFFKNLLYKSESPFTWTAAKWIEALAKNKKPRF